MSEKEIGVLCHELPPFLGVQTGFKPTLKSPDKPIKTILIRYYK